MQDEKHIKKNFNTKNSVKKGQTFLEFVLLMSTISVFATILMNGINKNMVKYWKRMVEDVTETKVDFR